MIGVGLSGPSGRVLGVRVDRVDYDEAVGRVIEAARAGRPLRVAAANVHVVMEARDDPALARALEAFELVVPDGQPLRWALDATGAPRLPGRVYGPELTRRVIVAAAAEGLPVFLYGATRATLDAMTRRIAGDLAPGARIAGTIAPPFGEALWGAAEADVARIRESGARIVIVGLGCPRQERWVGLHGVAVGVPCLAVGAAIDLLAGAKAMAPGWMQDSGLEWLYRLGTEPRRTVRRYALHNPRFAALLAVDLARRRLRGPG